MEFIAKENIGGFKKGDKVPEAQAKIWIGMYKESPVEIKESFVKPKQEQSKFKKHNKN